MAASHRSESRSLRLRLGDQAHALDRQKIVVGRSRSCDVRLRDDSVSRLHAALLWNGDALSLEDLGSSNGTYLNGERVLVPREVRAGDTVRFGSLRGVIELAIDLKRKAKATTSRVTSWNVADHVLGPPAGFGWRVLAALIDAGCLALGSILAFSPLLFVLWLQAGDRRPTGVPAGIDTPAVAAGVAGALWVAFMLAYVIHGWARRGGTPAMSLLGLRLLDWRYRSPIGYSRALLRLIAVTVTGLTLGLGFLVSLFRRDRRTLHDVLAGTMVAHRLPRVGRSDRDK